QYIGHVLALLIATAGTLQNRPAAAGRSRVRIRSSAGRSTGRCDENRRNSEARMSFSSMGRAVRCGLLFALSSFASQAAGFKQVGSISLAPELKESAIGVSLVNHTAYCLREKSGIVVVDVANIAVHRQLGFIPLRGPQQTSVVTNVIAYVAGGTLRNQPNPNPVLTVIVINDLANPKILTQTCGPNLVYDVELDGTSTYLAGPFNFITVLDLRCCFGKRG
ncbi:MAG: hypothetical protein KF791_17535, partial [Verrucomicrobiae bacterium]|nr:hypothetical protein [Verrucomicrobiae bacterium]